MLSEIDQNYKIIDYNESFIDDQRTFAPLRSTKWERKREMDQIGKERQKNELTRKIDSA